MATNFPPLVQGNYYHIYNRGNNRENLFIQDRNYPHFMELWWKHTSQVAETYAFCLLRNHFHALVYIKDEKDAPKQKTEQPGQSFSNLFNAYTRSVNNTTQRTGTLFSRPFKRNLITTEEYFLQLVVYIHQNPQKHKFVDDFREWRYSSYHELLADFPTRLQRGKLMEMVGSPQDFVRLHQEIQPLDDFEP